MSLRIYNTLTRRTEPFEPLTPGEVRMYVCGVTPYDLAHVGHARSALVFDVVRRYLTFRGWRVRFVRNFTDVEDKIIARAAERGEPWQELTRRYIEAHGSDMAWLGVTPPDVEPRATAHIAEMIGLIVRLVAVGTAYVVGGDVYFAVRQFPGYGRLSGRDLDDLRAGARVEVDERKRDPLDFALWKASKPGEPAWPSPWGPGRPGWHIECSAMSMGYLGETFDLHGGGQDLVFPHHENEIAQSEAVTGKPFVRCWMHNGFVQVNTEKMSKSLGNMLNIRDLQEGTPTHPGGFDREAVRLYLLGTHYRGPLEFREPRIEESRRALDRVRGVIGRAFQVAGPAGIPDAELPWASLSLSRLEPWLAAAGGDDLHDQVTAAVRQFTDAMDDDFNTPQALAGLFELSRALNAYSEAGLSGSRVERFRCGAAALLALGRSLGLLWWQVDPYEFTAESLEQFRDLVEAREAARLRRDWPRADEIRAELSARGVLIEDTPRGPRLRWSQEARR
jgi:cysteinyl-tRNA synthetase